MTDPTGFTFSSPDNWRQVLTDAFGLAGGEIIEHFVVVASVGSGDEDGLVRKVFIVPCEEGCPNTNLAHLLQHVIDAVGERN